MSAPPVGMRLKDIPVLASDASNVKQFADAVREAVQTFRGTRGNDLDRALTLRDLQEGGAIANSGIGTGVGGTPVPGPPGPPGSGSPYVPDPTPPPTPTGLAVTAGLSYLYFEHDTPTYTTGHGHDRTIVYGRKWPAGDALPTFADAVRLCDFQGTIGAYPTEPATRWRIWIKWQSIDGVQSTSPAGGANGVLATTGQDVSLLLSALSGQITESQLYAALGARIDLIDGVMPGSVTARVASEAAARAAADSSLASSLSTVIASTTSNAAAITAEATARANADTALASSISTVSAANSSNAAAIASETTARVSGDSALASSISTLGVTVAGNTAAISTEATARATADGALQTQWTVKTDINGYVSGFGLASTLNNAVPSSSFIVRADSFSVASPTGPGITPAVPFIVRTTPGTVNGVSYPAGVYIDAAYILDLTAAIARLGTAWIDDAKIANLSAAKLTAGSGVIGGDLKSTNYVNGVSGWIVRPSGYAEFDFGMIRSTLIAGQIGANYITTLMLAAGSVTAGKISVTSLDAITATIGLLRTATSGARVEIASNYGKVFDSSNVKRVQWGDLTA